MGRELAVDASLPWNSDIDGYDSVMIREDEDSAEYYGEDKTFIDGRTA